MPAIDPFKLLKKYFWLAPIAFVIGIVLGVGSHFLFLRVAPVYKAIVLFECLPPYREIGESPTDQRVSEDELERFMETQVAIMTSDDVLQAIVDDPRLQREAEGWAKKFTRQGVVVSRDAFEDIQDRVRAQVRRGTQLVELSATAATAADAAGLVSLARSNYESRILDNTSSIKGDHRDTLLALINDLEKQIDQRKARRERILIDENIETLTAGLSESQRTLDQVTQDMADVRMQIEAFEDMVKGFEEVLSSPAGLTYPDSMRATVEQEPIIRNLRNEVLAAEIEITRLKQEGYGEEHRQLRRMRSTLDARRNRLSEKIEERLLSAFNAQVDGSKRTLSQLQAQEADLLDRREEAQRRNNELTRIQAQITDLEQEIERLIGTLTTRKAEFDELSFLGRSDYATRVRVIQSERLPDGPVFPRLPLMVVGGLALTFGLVGGVVVLREVLDQRVKSAADVAALPRTRVLGVIPSASEDPTRVKKVERVFVEHPTGVLSESFRQVRGPLLKKLQQSGHKTLLFVSGAPGSGTTSVVVNLAEAIAGTGQRVLVIDANQRRAGVHRVFGLEAEPGLAEVLAGERGLEDTVRETETPGLHLLTAGASEQRVYERLNSESMGTLLAEARGAYDLVLLDVAPAVVSGDAISLANRCDACVLVVRAFGEKRGMVARISSELTDTRASFLGVLVNGVRSAAGGYMRRNIRATHEYQNGKG